jgi:hypothetical protein
MTGQTTVIAMFAEHWAPNDRNQVAVECTLCRSAVGVVRQAKDHEWWKPYTRVAITARTSDGLVVDISHWHPWCWSNLGRAAKEAEFPGADFVEIGPGW